MTTTNNNNENKHSKRPLYFFLPDLYAEDGHQLWLPLRKALPVKIVCNKNSPTLEIAIRELQQGWRGKAGGTVSLILEKNKEIKGDGFKIRANSIQAGTDLGILYGVFELLRCQQSGQSPDDEIYKPSYERRILNHWDNLNGSIERGMLTNLYSGERIALFLSQTKTGSFGNSMPAPMLL